MKEQLGALSQRIYYIDTGSPPQRSDIQGHHHRQWRYRDVHHHRDWSYRDIITEIRDTGTPPQRREVGYKQAIAPTKCLQFSVSK